MPNTYVALRTETIATATPSVTFSLSGISGYTDLVLVANFTVATSSANLVMTFNGDTTSGLYSKTQMEGTGTTAVSGRTANANNIGLDSNIGDDATSPSIHIINLMNYANTSVFKTVLHRQSGFWSANPGTAARVGLWRNTNAITSITLNNGGTNFTVGSTFSLYGIANADQGAAKATGGIITEDSQYWYHTFGASGAFIPKQALTCDYLVLAGGGAGALGGGGAGGLRSTVTATGGGGALESAVSLASGTNYTITVGAGGAGAFEARGTSGSNSSISGTGLTTITATGGGAGGYTSATGAGLTGGSGGGGGHAGTFAGGTAASPTQGFAGGSTAGTNGGSGGGGAGAVGANSAGLPGANGGNGNASIINGFSVIRGGGGGGGGESTTPGTGGTGGGGNGALGTPNTGGAGTVNLGGGGGGRNWQVSGTGGAGGSGVVVIRYAK
jgi:hypothetical protein